SFRYRVLRCNMAAKTIKRITYILIGFILILLGGQAFLPTYAAAAVQNYSNVLTDLEKDKSFNAGDYKSIADDYSLQVIQIAESTDGELFLYVYQPCQLTNYLVATSVNMALSESVDGTKIYSLTLLNSSGVFCKYLVNGVTVATDDERYYNISSIFRAWIDGVDEPPADGQTINEVSFKVGKLYTAYTDNGTANYTCVGQEVVEVTSKYCGFVSYWSGTNPWTEYYCDAHYIAFNTDRDIDRVKNADVEFLWKTITENDGGIGTTSTVDNGKKTVTLNDVEEATVTSRGWFQGNNYSWKRIRTVEQFIQEENITDETVLAELKDKAFVLNFFETEYSKTGPYSEFLVGHYYKTTYSRLYDETILRLEFEQDGKTYNLGAVDNKQTNDKANPDNQTDSGFNFFTYIWNCLVKLFTGKADLLESIVAIFVLFVVVALLPILGFIFPTFGRGLLSLLKGVAYVIKYLILAVFYIITAPFRLIAWLINRRKDGGNGEQ
ncbi:MAG: hypothetical protein ACI4QN_06815, partial [Candidatus Coproplasma sp.]